LFSGPIAVVQTRPKDTTQNCKNGDREGTNGQHTGREDKASTVHAFWKGARQSESALISTVAPKNLTVSSAAATRG
jgi:hypothetical protein